MASQNMSLVLFYFILIVLSILILYPEKYFYGHFKQEIKGSMLDEKKHKKNSR